MSFSRLILLCCVALLTLVQRAGAESGDPRTHIVLERLACFGTCPVYRVELDADGRMVFEGRANVKMMGRRTGEVSRDAVQLLIRRFEELDFFRLPLNFEKDCSSRVEDGPGLALAFRRGAQSRRVEDSYGCYGNPKIDEMRRLADEIDRLIETRRWTGRRD